MAVDLSQRQCRCGGLAFPKLPHLHAEKCPAREAPTVLFRENFREREMFDSMTSLSGGPLQHVAAVLDTWGRASSGGSYAEQHFIMANECLIAADRLATLENREPVAWQVKTPHTDWTTHDGAVLDHFRGMAETDPNYQLRPLYL